jgi:hypothetical protein
MHGLILAISVVMVMAGIAHAQTNNNPPSSDDLVPAMQNISSQVNTSMAAACRGPSDSQLMIGTGLPNNPSDDIRCQSVTVLITACLSLASAAGGIQEGVLNGQTTYGQEANTLQNQSGDASDQLSALYLARQASTSMSPGQLALAVYSHCTSLISRAAQ